MKKGILLLLLFASFFAQAQSLKEALFSGKLKNTPGTTIRKGDSLILRTDSTEQERAITQTNTPAIKTPASDSVKTQTASPAVAAATDEEAPAATDASTDTAEETTPATTAAAAPKTNNALWKTYMDSVAGVLKTEALSSKKIKRGSYYVMVSYTIETDGQTSVGDVFVSPENDFLQQQVKDRLTGDTPRLAPVLTSTGTARKVQRKASFTLTKE